VSADDEDPPAQPPFESPAEDPAEDPVEGLVRDVETMADGRRRITFYSHSSSPATPEGTA
jgi:hypothetical protein